MPSSVSLRDLQNKIDKNGGIERMDTQQDERIDQTISNMVMAGILAKGKEADTLRTLNSYDDMCLNMALISSEYNLALRLAKTALAWRN